MQVSIFHQINNEPVPDDVGIIRITAAIFREHDYLTYTTESLAKDFLDDDQDECKSKENLNYFLLDAGINDGDIIDALMNLVNHVDEVACAASNEYSHECALDVWLEFHFLPEDDIEDGQMEDDLVNDQMEEAVQASFDESSNTRFRPASKQVVKSLTRKIYNKKIQKENKKTKINKEISLEEYCTICLEEFSDGGRVVTLPCGHDFDDECIVKWLDTNHVCPLCRFKLPCEEDLWTPVALS